MPDFSAIIFDFDGVLLESEYEGNRELARLLTDFGHPHSVEDTLHTYVGLNGKDFIAAIEERIGTQLPAEFHDHLKAMSVRALRDGIAEVAGAVEFVRSLPPNLPKAVASSSSTRWITGHLAHLGLSDAFGSHIYSGREHVERGKPAPDLYLHAAAQLEVPIADCVMFMVLTIFPPILNTCSRSFQAILVSNSMPSVVASIVAARSSAYSPAFFDVSP